MLEVILPSMQNMTHVYFDHVGLGSAGLRCLSSFLRQNSSLLWLTIYEEEIDPDVAGVFSNALSHHPTLEELGLGNCGLDDSISLQRILDGCERVKSLQFRQNKIKSASAAAIAGFIGGNDAQTESIDVRSNLMSDADVSHFFDSLRKNTTLKWLHMQRNELTDEGKRKMLNAIHDTTDVASIVRSNHTCNLDLFEEDLFEESSPPVNFRREMAMKSVNADLGLSIDQRIREKVVFALCDKPAILSSLLCHLDESPLGLVPHVLALIQEGQKYYQ